MYFSIFIIDVMIATSKQKINTSSFNRIGKSMWPFFFWKNIHKNCWHALGISYVWMLFLKSQSFSTDSLTEHFVSWWFLIQTESINMTARWFKTVETNWNLWLVYVKCFCLFLGFIMIFLFGYHLTDGKK